ncbi:MAG: hypothetical protein JSR47_02005 [Proteobacteria bacterium]|nr:hypothetical protein [Pseudomonadota bacterium]
MRSLIFLALLLVTTPAYAQLVAPLTTSDGKIACIQGQTGVGRASNWEAVRDPQALGGWALAETAGDATDLRFPLCISAQVTALDFDATLRFKLVSGTHQRAAGLVMRALSASDYYVARASGIDNTVRFYRVAGGRRAELGGKQVPVSTGEQHALRVTAKRDKFEVFLDDVSLFKVTDAGLLQPGPIGVWSQADSVTHFQSLVVGDAPK